MSSSTPKPTTTANISLDIEGMRDQIERPYHLTLPTLDPIVQWTNTQEENTRLAFVQAFVDRSGRCEPNFVTLMVVTYSRKPTQSDEPITHRAEASLMMSPLAVSSSISCPSH